MFCELKVAPSRNMSFVAFTVLLYFVIHVYLKNPHVRVLGPIAGESTAIRVNSVNSSLDTLRLHPNTLTSLSGQHALAGFVTVVNRNANYSTNPFERQFSSLPVFITEESLLAVSLNHGTAIKSGKHPNNILL